MLGRRWQCERKEDEKRRCFNKQGVVDNFKCWWEINTNNIFHLENLRQVKWINVQESSISGSDIGWQSNSVTVEHSMSPATWMPFGYYFFSFDLTVVWFSLFYHLLGEFFHSHCQIEISPPFHWSLLNVTCNSFTAKWIFNIWDI